MSLENAQALLDGADVLFDAAACSKAVDDVAKGIRAQLAHSQPLVLAVMGGAVVFAGQLLPKLDFPLEFDYLHVSRYGAKTSGGKLHWKVEPSDSVRDRAVLVIDDILDEGETMNAIRSRVLELGARSFHCAVFCEKTIKKPKPIQADFVGIHVPDRFVFGFGMDVAGAWRNLPAVYAMR